MNILNQYVYTSMTPRNFYESLERTYQVHSFGFRITDINNILSSKKA